MFKKIWSFIKVYWPEILVFGIIFGTLLTDLLPGFSWINTDSDGPHYTLAAKYWGVAHNTSAPAYLILQHFMLYLPFGSEAHRMGMISVLATTMAAILIYKIVVLKLTGNKKARLFGLIAAVIYGGSALIISQSTIIETYALVTMLTVLTYYFALKKKFVWTAVTLGLILAVHPLYFVITYLVFVVAFKELRNWKMILSTWAFALFYLYIPISKHINDVPAMWGNETATGFWDSNFGTMWMLTGGIALVDMPKRILDSFAILGVSMGLSIFVVIWYFIKQHTLKSVSLWMIILPWLFFVANMSNETYVYMTPCIAFGAIVAGVAFAKIKMRYVYATGLIAIVLLGYNCNYFDIGRTLDPKLSAQSFYDNQLPKVPNGQILLTGGWTWAIIYLYNKQENRHIIPVSTDTLPSTHYLALLKSEGIKFTPTTSTNPIDQQWKVAESIAIENPNVWLAKPTVPSQYQYEIVPSATNMNLITQWFGHTASSSIEWKPSNPYDFITGAIEVSQWKFVLQSQHNARFAIECIIYALGLYWLILKVVGRKHEDKVREEKEEVDERGIAHH